ncbi:MAG TPA: urate oxidase [Pirellulales bacterium]|jgi:urate oxidase|nr:urate oxidase [Pirellulales bacterium]
MSVRLVEQSHGKSRVRLIKVTRHADRHDLKELSIDIALEGEFSASYLTGDNRQIIATDTMKNTVYALAADHPLTDAESFALVLAGHFIERNAHVAAATVSCDETLWRRIVTPAGWHPHAFIAAGVEHRTCRVLRTREATTIEAGIAGLPLLKTTDSAFCGFLRDEFTTLPETDDRIFATLLDASWKYRAGVTGEFNAHHGLVCRTVIDVFADHKSKAVQQTLYAMGSAALDACPAIDEIRLAMPNQHRTPVNLEPFGRPNRNEIFVATSEPFGLITATLRREGT